MKYCNRCLYPENHPLGIIFDNEGVCSGCRVHEEKDTLDWKNKERNLISILDKYKSISKNNYDCIIPVSGGKDSYFIVHLIKNVYKLNPLLVSYNTQYNTIIGFRNLDYLKTIFDCDFVVKTINPQTVKKITRFTFEKLGSIYWHCLAGQTVFPVQIATKFNIPLIIWGAHQGIDQVGMFSHTDEVEMTRKYRKEHDLMSIEAEDLVLNKDSDLNYKDIEDFIYPSDYEIQKVGVRGLYLNNFIRWDSKAQHERMINLYNYQTIAQNRTFNTYEDIDSLLYSDVHDYIKILKHGYGKVTDHATREIRLKRMTREEGIELIEKYQYKSLKYVKQFCDWLAINEEEFNNIVEKFRNKNLWVKDKNGFWKLKFSPKKINIDEVNSVRLTKNQSCHYQLTNYKSRVNPEKMYLLARGY